MRMNTERLIMEALSLPTNAIAYHVSERLASAFPERGVMAGTDTLFDVEEYARSGQCTFSLSGAVHNQILTLWRRPRQEMAFPSYAGGWNPAGLGPSATWSEKGTQERARNAWFEVTWRDHRLDVLAMNWNIEYQRSYHFWILVDRRDIAEDFFVAVCAWNSELRGEVLVYNDGCWRKDEDLYHDIKGATLDNLVLPGALKETICADLRQFFGERGLYEQYGIPWKRGVIFVGPPGNGKTHAVKALLNDLDKPCLYVKSFRAERRTDESCIGQVFEQARRSAPCVLVLEDLDSLVTPYNRSFFLNELDGFAANIGILTLATTNHPERLDPSILDRPSRFDRKYPFDLPAVAERRAYLALWNTNLQPALRLAEPVQDAVAADSEGFSYAYLKELLVSAMMRWITTPEEGAMNRIVPEQVVLLREQMASIPPEPPPAPEPPRGPSHVVVYGG